MPKVLEYWNTVHTTHIAPSSGGRITIGFHSPDMVKYYGVITRSRVKIEYLGRVGIELDYSDYRKVAIITSDGVI